MFWKLFAIIHSDQSSELYSIRQDCICCLLLRTWMSSWTRLTLPHSSSSWERRRAEKRKCWLEQPCHFAIFSWCCEFLFHKRQHGITGKKCFPLPWFKLTCSCKFVRCKVDVPNNRLHLTILNIWSLLQSWCSQQLSASDNLKISSLFHRQACCPGKIQK